MKDTSQKPPQVPKDALLGELKSIKDLLLGQHNEKNTPSSDKIPLLNDIVSNQYHPLEQDSNSPPLNLDNIFNDDDLGLEDSTFLPVEDTAINFDQLDDMTDLDTNISIPEFTLSTAIFDTPPPPLTTSDTSSPNTVPLQQETSNKTTEVCLDLLIQEIVDEFIPTLETQLRQRLSMFAPEVLKQLAKKHLD